LNYDSVLNQLTEIIKNKMSTYDAIEWSNECPWARKEDPPTMTAGQVLALLVPLQEQQGVDARIYISGVGFSSKALAFSMLLSEVIADVQKRQAKSLLGSAKPIYIRDTILGRRAGIREIQMNTLFLV
jgi:hypothetical protein